ncbi:hypothetical protein [Leisingera methylohalidivorans]|uniref:hypothetical protein n=1 Tax=Leisingera methylohalidivorans TaxID=133924 RepID=UPI0005C752C7|nr:hypothetical protein [Leisingera methylohalidivorans]
MALEDLLVALAEADELPPEGDDEPETDNQTPEPAEPRESRRRRPKVTDEGIDELRDMLASARVSVEAWHSFLEDFVAEPDIIARCGKNRAFTLSFSVGAHQWLMAALKALTSIGRQLSRPLTVDRDHCQ